MRTPPLILCVLLVFGVNAYPWSGEGHRAIAEAAGVMFTAEAKATVAKIFGNDDLAVVGGMMWGSPRSIMPA